MHRRQFLVAAAALHCLLDTDGEPCEAPDFSGAETSVSAPLEACFGTADLHFHDETVDVRVTTDEVWTGQGYEPVADLCLRLHGGEIGVTLYEDDVRALVTKLEPALEG